VGGCSDEELWKAIAGPLVDVPCVGQSVFYFPQGHMEQVSFFNFPLIFVILYLILLKVFDFDCVAIFDVLENCGQI